MISSLRGTVLRVIGTTAVIEVGGIGFSVQITPDHSLALRPGEQTFVLTSFVVREDSMSLFGFPDQDSLEIFELLVAVTGVGPKSAMGVLSVLSPNDIARAVTAEDDAAFRAVSGIGPKTAKLIVLSLSGKVVAFQPRETPRPAQPASSVSENVLVALVGLGWPEHVAADAVAESVAESTEAETATVQSLLRIALGRLAPSQPQERR